MSTLLAIPLLTAAFFFTAAFRAWAEIARGSLALALVLAALGLALLVGTLRHGNITATAFGTSLATLIGAGAVSRAIAAVVPSPLPLTRVLVVEAVMLVLTVINIVVERRHPPAARTVM